MNTLMVTVSNMYEIDNFIHITVFDGLLGNQQFILTDNTLLLLYGKLSVFDVNYGMIMQENVSMISDRGCDYLW